MPFYCLRGSLFDSSLRGRQFHLQARSINRRNSGVDLPDPRQYTCTDMQSFTIDRPTNPKAAAACASPLDALLRPQLFKALADPTRLKLLSCIAKCGRGCTVTEIAACCAVDLSVVSRHLAALSRAKVLKAEKRGRTVYYTVQYAALVAELRQLASAIESCDEPCNGVRDDGRKSCC